MLLCVDIMLNCFLMLLVFKAKKQIAGVSEETMLALLNGVRIVDCFGSSSGICKFILEDKMVMSLWIL